MLKEYETAYSQIDKLRNSSHTNDFFVILADLFEAVISEKTEKDYEKAEAMYRSVIKKTNKFYEYGNSYKAYAYFGLSRIYLKKDKIRSGEYRKLAFLLTAYPHVNFD